MATTQDKAAPQAVEQAFDWDAFLARSDEERATIVADEAQRRADWLAADPGTPVADGLAYLEELDRPNREAAAAKALGISVEALRAMFALAERAAAPKATTSRKGGRSSAMDADEARDYIEGRLAEDRKVPKYDVIRAYRSEVGPVNMAVWDELWAELSGR